MKLILYGASETSEELIAANRNHIEYIVDNDPQKINKTYISPDKREIHVFHPSKLREDQGDIFVIIMAQNPKSIAEIEDELIKTGLEKNKSFAVLQDAPINLDYLSWNRYYKKNIICEGGKFYPRILHLGLTDVCNLQCLFCGFHGLKTPWNNSGHFMTMETAEKIAQQAKHIPSLDTLYITHDGEDFLNKQWSELVTCILRNTNISKFIVYTNGMLLNDDNIDRLLKIKCKEVGVVISIDGKSAEENDRLRKGGNYEIIKKNVINARKRLDANRYKMVINNNHVIEERLIQENKYIFHKFNQEIPDFLVKDFGEFDILIESTPTLFLPSIEMGFPQIEDYRLVKARKSERISGCFNPFETISINAEGKVLFCGCCVTQDVIGDIREENMLELWQKDIRLNEAREDIRDRRTTPEMCKNCASKISGDFYLVCR